MQPRLVRKGTRECEGARVCFWEREERQDSWPADASSCTISKANAEAVGKKPAATATAQHSTHVTARVHMHGTTGRERRG